MTCSQYTTVQRYVPTTIRSTVAYDYILVNVFAILKVSLCVILLMINLQCII